MKEPYNIDNKVKSVKEYIDFISELKDKYIDEDTRMVFRGEPKIFETFGMPGIFRADHLKKDKRFENNILLEMMANKLSTGNNLLELAIDAQHGGFPSRLLDVSFNSIIALYFACVSKPERKSDEDKCDSHVIVYRIKKMYCPTANNVINTYKDMVENPDSYINDAIFERNHKLIDYMKINNRIMAQQGALILFQGNKWKPIPEWNYDRIIIDCNYKSQIAIEIESLFGINTSFVYPEIDYSIDKIQEKAKNINSNEFSMRNEIYTCFDKMKEEIYNRLLAISKISESDAKITQVRFLEKEIESWKEDLILFQKKYSEKLLEELNDDQLKTLFNSLIDEYQLMFTYYLESQFKSSADKLKWR